jgi:hypothetical protein
VLLVLPSLLLSLLLLDAFSLMSRSCDAAWLPLQAACAAHWTS